MKFKLITAKEARAKKLPRYFTGKPCLNGNITERRTSNCNCLCPACAAAVSQRVMLHYRTDPDYRASQQASKRIYLRRVRAEAKKNRGAA